MSGWLAKLGVRLAALFARPAARDFATQLDAALARDTRVLLSARALELACASDLSIRTDSKEN